MCARNASGGGDVRCPKRYRRRVAAVLLELYIFAGQQAGVDRQGLDRRIQPAIVDFGRCEQSPDVAGEEGIEHAP